MHSQVVASWFQSTSNGVCISGLSSIPPIFLVLIPVSLWLIQHAVATLWGEFVKRLIPTWIDELRKTKAELKAVKRVLDQQKVQSEIERDLFEKTLLENDRLLRALLQSQAELSVAKAELAHNRNLKIPKNTDS